MWSQDLGLHFRAPRPKPARLTPGCSWRNEPGVVHSIEALEDATVLEVSTPQLDDVVRLSDRYGRGS
jgi:hypothetical protein